MTEYSVGFAITPDRRVALIRKNRPQWQAGRLNAPGGHIEPGETPLQATAREFREETGVDVGETRWHHFLTLTCGSTARVYYFHTELRPEEAPRTTTDEAIVLCDVDMVLRGLYTTLPNIPWTLGMALSFSQGEGCSAFAVEEV